MADKTASAGKAEKKARRKQAKAESPGRLKQLGAAYTMTRAGDPRIGWILGGIFVGVLAVMVVLGFVVGHPALMTVFGLSVALLAVTIVFGRRAQASAYRQVEGRPGAVLQSLGNLRKSFTVSQTPVAFTRDQDMVFRVIGKCGVVLVGEGQPARVKNLLLSEHRRHARVVGDMPVHEISAGTGEGQVPLPKISATIMKLPRTLSGTQMTELEHRLKALTATQGMLPIPKGPMPKGMKVPRAPR
jgi:hypothetical protein